MPINKLMSCCALFLLSFAGQLNAQIPDQLKNKLAGKTNLKNIMKEVDEYYAMDQHITSTETEDSSRNEPDDEYAKWKRWEWYMSSRLGADGSFVDISKMNREAWLNRKNEGLNQPNSPTNIEGVVTNGAWGFVGPDSYGTVWGGLPGNGRVDRVAFDPTNAAILYAGTPAGGFWKSIDYGTTWICFSDYPSALGISGIVEDKINTSIIYILTGDGDSNVGGFVSASGYERASIGVLKSTDGGKTWTPTGSFPIPGGQTFYGTSLSQCPSNTNILIAATSLGLYRTSDAGVSWNAIPYAGNYVYSDVKFNPLNGNSVYAGSGAGVG